MVLRLWFVFTIWMEVMSRKREGGRRKVYRACGGISLSDLEFFLSTATVRMGNRSHQRTAW